MARSSTILFKGGALRQLKRGSTKSGGRNNLGRITAFHRGGGAKRSLRTVDMARRAPGLVGTVERLEYDPSRTARLALVRWDDDDGDTPREASPLTFPRRALEVLRRNGKKFPKTIGDVPRRELRSAVATICGMPMPGAGGTRAGRKVVRIDGSKGRGFSSAAFVGGEYRGIGIILSKQEEKILPGKSTTIRKTCSEVNTTLLREFDKILKIGKT